MKRDIIVGHSSATDNWTLLVESSTNDTGGRIYTTYFFDRSDARRLHEQLGQQLGMRNAEDVEQEAIDKHVSFERTIAALKGALTKARKRGK